MVNRKTKTMTIAAVIIIFTAFIYTGKPQAAELELPVQNHSGAIINTEISTVKHVETPSAENYIINVSGQASDNMTDNPFAGVAVKSNI